LVSASESLEELSDSELASVAVLSDFAVVSAFFSSSEESLSESEEEESEESGRGVFLARD
jgi:hypothetical protein